MFMSPPKPAIGAPIAVASTAATKSLFVFIDECPSGFRSMLPHLHGSRRTTRAPNASDRFAERSERLSELGTKEFGFFPGGEVTALVDLVEVYQVAIGAPGPCLRGLIILVRKNRDGHRERDF